MKSKEYVNNHDFGYGQIEEQNYINKLKLRNKEDIKEYVLNVLDNIFDFESQKLIPKLILFNDTLIIELINL